MINILLILFFVLSSFPSHEAISPSVGGSVNIASVVKSTSVVARVSHPAEYEPYSADVIYAPTGTGPYVVCVDAAKVYGSPSRDRIVRYTLSRGTEVNVRERAKWIAEGWAMIKPAYWVSAKDLCKKS